MGCKPGFEAPSERLNLGLGGINRCKGLNPPKATTRPLERPYNAKTQIGIRRHESYDTIITGG